MKIMKLKKIIRLLEALSEIIENKPHARRFFYTLIWLAFITVMTYTLTH